MHVEKRKQFKRLPGAEIKITKVGSQLGVRN